MFVVVVMELMMLKDADDVDAHNGDSVDAADGGVGADCSVDVLMLIELTR